MSQLQINLKKISTERAALHCRRPDGSETWSRVHPFFPRHDLTHFAVESALGIRQGFFGLVSAGWDLADFIQKSAAARLPTESIWAECAVGATELLGLPPPSLAGWQDTLDQSIAGLKLPAFRRVNAGEFARMNALRTARLQQWAALPVGETLTLEFALV